MSVRIALAGNPNSGKTTMFNALTGSNQYVGNWPGVTVEKKEGKLKNHKEVVITDLPGIYSLSPYTLEEVVARNYLIQERPDVIINIVDGTNLERNLYLSTQIMELGIPVVIAVNMMDAVEKRGDRIDLARIGKKLGCEAVGISALKGTGVMKAAEKALALAGDIKEAAHIFSRPAEDAISLAEKMLPEGIPLSQRRFFAIKCLENDEKAGEWMERVPDVSEVIRQLEETFDDDVESIITNERYEYISSMIDGCMTKAGKEKLTVSDRIDKIVTNRIFALPIFAIVMILVYYVSVTSVGTLVTDWTNDGLFGDGWYLCGIGRGEYDHAVANAVKESVSPEQFGIWVPGIPAVAEHALNAIGCADWLKGLLVEGIIGGVGAVLGFVPQMFVLFLFLAFLESCGYMARVAFIMDRIFRRFGLSGKSFIPMLIGSGSGVPGIMASRTIENDRDRKMTIITTTFIPCGAKLPIIALIASAMFDGAGWVAPSAYFLGIGAVIVSGIILKKTKIFAGDAAPFVMELPAYHLPTAGTVLRSMWERGWSFIRRAGTIILVSSIIIWFGSVFGWTEGVFGFHADMELSDSLLGHLGNAVSWIFAPLGFGEASAAVAVMMGLVAKEEVVGVFGVLDFEGLSQAAGYAFLAFNLLCAPCFAAMGAIKREMNNIRWFWFAIGYQCGFAYIIALILYQFGMLFAGTPIVPGMIAASVFLLGLIYLIVRPAERSRWSLFERRRAAWGRQ